VLSDLVDILDKILDYVRIREDYVWKLELGLDDDLEELDKALVFEEIEDSEVDEPSHYESLENHPDFRHHTENDLLKLLIRTLGNFAQSDRFVQKWDNFFDDLGGISKNPVWHGVEVLICVPLAGVIGQSLQIVQNGL